MKELTLDCETTGLPAKHHAYDKDFMEYPYIVTLAWKVNDEETKYFIINQEGRPIPPEATAIHGITDAMAAASPYMIEDILIELHMDGEGADFSIGHNIFFDTSTIKANVLRLIHQERMTTEFYSKLEELLHRERRIDTMHKTIKFCNLPGKYGPKWPKLTELHFKLFGENFEAHNSKDDVNATRKSYLRLKELGVI